MTYWLKEHGFTFKKPEKVPGKLCPEKQAQFIKSYKELKAVLGPKEDIFFVDAMHPEYQTQAVSGWIKKGVCKTLQTTGKQLRLHFTGALSLKNMHVVIREYQTIGADEMVNFFKELECESEAEVIYVILDNAQAHKSHKVKEFLKTSRIKLFFLPPYSPNLNPIERLWKVFREKTLYNRYFPTCAEFFEATRTFFSEKVHRMKKALACRINDNFQIIQLNPIKLA
jgi:transposase